MTHHRDFEGIAAGYALHALEPEDEQRLAAHLLTCHSCARLVADTAAVGSAFADLIPPEAPPQGLRARILEAAAAEPRSPVAKAVKNATQPPVQSAGRSREVPVLPVPGPVAASARPPHRDRIRRLQMRSRVAVGALAAVVGIGVAVPVTLAVSNGSKSGTSNTALAQWLTGPDARVVTLRGSGATSSKAVVAKAVMSSAGMLLVASGMPVNDKAKSVYVLWAANGQGDRTAVATFDVHNGTPVELTASKLPFKTADISQVAVSYEPGRKAPLHPTDVVLSGTAA